MKLLTESTWLPGITFGFALGDIVDFWGPTELYRVISFRNQQPVFQKLTYWRASQLTRTLSPELPPLVEGLKEAM